MLIRENTLEAIRRGDVTLQFRRWTRPGVKAGGTLRTKLGLIAIGAIMPVALDDITDAEAQRAGYADRTDALDWIQSREGTPVRIEVSWLGEDPRHALRTAELDAAALAEVVAALDALDVRADIGPWTLRAMELIAGNPGRLAEELARKAGLERAPFKSRIRKLKAMGLTESLKVGYRLSPRGRSVHRARTGRTDYPEPADASPPRRGSS